MEPSAIKKLTRGPTSLVGGVCAGLAKYYGLSKGRVRAVFVIGSIFYGAPIFIYLILWGIIPKDV